MENHSSHATHVRDIAIIGGVVAGVILAPYLLPAMGWGTLSVAQDALSALHSLSEGSGLAALATQAVSHIPLIGETLAKGGFFNAFMSGGMGLAAVFGYDMLPDNKVIRALGKMVKYGLLATSALTALPATLTGISNGLIYLANEFGGAELAQSVAEMVAHTIGTIPFSDAIVRGTTTAAGLLPHLATCGLAFFASGTAFATDELIHSSNLSETQKQNVITQFASMDKDQKLATLRKLHNKGYHGAHVHDGVLTFNDHLLMSH